MEKAQAEQGRDCQGLGCQSNPPVWYLLWNRQLGKGLIWELCTQSSFPTQKPPFKEQYRSGGDRYARNYETSAEVT